MFSIGQNRCLIFFSFRDDLMMTLNVDEDEDFEPLIRRRFTKGQGWEEYRGSTKIWTRICEKCTENVCSSSVVSLCAFHQKKRKGKIKRLNTKKKDLNILNQVER